VFARIPLGVALLFTLLPEIAAAQASSAASAQAAELFEQGRALIARQDFRAACPKFAESDRLEPKVGTRLNLADCEEHLGQIVAARGHWQDAANLAHSLSDEREAVAKQRFTALDPRVAKLAVSLPASTPGGLRVERDGVELGAGSLGAALPVDPGSHTIVVSGAGYEDRSYSVTLAEGEAKALTVEPGAQKVVDVPAAPPPASSWSGRKTLALATAGVGVAGVVVGAVFGILTISDYHSSNTGVGSCSSGTPQCGSASAADERNTAYRFGNVSTAAFIVGGVGLAAGGVLWFTAPAPSTSAARGTGGPSIAIGPGSVLVEGAF
jgi:hypothetical protein